MSYGGRLEALFTVPSSVTIAVTNNGGGPTTVTIAAGVYRGITAFCTYLQSALTTQRAPSGGGVWAVSVSTGASGTGFVTISISVSTFTITWNSTDLRDLLGFTATITTQTSATGTKNARGLWLPKCPVTCDGHPSIAPEITDSRSTEGPTGVVVTLGGTSKYRHRNLVWSHVAVDRVYEAATVGGLATCSSYQQWWKDTQRNSGHAWFSRGSAFLAYWDNAGTDTAFGADLSSTGPTAGWTASPAIASFEPRRTSGQWLGMWTIEIPTIVTSG